MKEAFTRKSLLILGRGIGQVMSPKQCIVRIIDVNWNLFEFMANGPIGCKWQHNKYVDSPYLRI